MISFATHRLLIHEFNSDNNRKTGNESIYNQIPGILSPAVTETLPREWSTINTLDAAKSWMSNRIAESKVLMVSSKENGCCIGFIFLFQMENIEQLIAYRFGYLLAESVWGKGLGTELVSGLVNACAEAGNIESLSGGVENNNRASIRVLEKIGFSISTLDTESEDTTFYEYQF